MKGYELLDSAGVTSAMEDYLEMIIRLNEKHRGNGVRITKLAEMLNVKPSSASKMAANLKEKGLISFEKYGIIAPTSEGIALGSYLLWRHEVVNSFLCWLNGSENELEQAEKIEHFLDCRTVKSLEALLKKQT